MNATPYDQEAEDQEREPKEPEGDQLTSAADDEHEEEVEPAPEPAEDPADMHQAPLENEDDAAFLPADDPRRIAIEEKRGEPFHKVSGFRDDAPNIP